MCSVKLQIYQYHTNGCSSLRAPYARASKVSLRPSGYHKRNMKDEPHSPSPHLVNAKTSSPAVELIQNPPGRDPPASKPGALNPPTQQPGS